MNKGFKQDIGSVKDLITAQHYYGHIKIPGSQFPLTFIILQYVFFTSTDCRLILPEVGVPW